MNKIKTDKPTLRKFGITMAIAFLAIAVIIFIRHKHGVLPMLSISAAFWITAIVAPAILKSIYIIWMKFAYLLGWINSRILLIVIFYLVFAPTGLVMKLLRVDLLDRKIEKDKPSYWKTKDDLDSSPLGYEKRF